jgi:hypothetical protein
MMREIALESQAHSNESFSGNGNDCSNSTTMLQTDFSLPSSRFRKLPDLGDLNFNKAVDHLSRLASIIENQVMRQHGGLPPSAKSIISFIDHMCDTINRALVAAGKPWRNGIGLPRRPRTNVRELAILRLEQQSLPASG